MNLDTFARAFGRNPTLYSIILGILGAAIGTVLWFIFVVFTGWQFGIIAILVGIIVGYAVLLGSGNNGGQKFQWISVALTFVGMFVSEYILNWYFAREYLLEEGYTGVSMFLPLDVIVGIVIDSLKNEPLTLLFWAIALYEAYKIPKMQPRIQ